MDDEFGRVTHTVPATNSWDDGVALLISNAIGWSSAVLFAIAATWSHYHRWMHPRGPSAYIVATSFMADATNMIGAYLFEAPAWQLVVGVVLLISDAVLLLFLFTLKPKVHETVRPFVRVVLGCSLYVVAFLAFAPIEVTLRTSVIVLGSVSAACNVGLRAGRLTPSSSPSTLSWVTIAALSAYSLSIMTHPESSRGAEYVVESAPWLIGSVGSAFLEVVSATQQQRHRVRARGYHLV
eukprot:Sspe_Gene.3864::Locus_1289_Transcript_1_1_Confidence_1.000_Length_910::g.3864::m.3864